MSNCSCPTCIPIRPEIRREVDSFIGLRDQIRNAEAQLRHLFAARMALEQLTPTEHAMVCEALGRAD